MKKIAAIITAAVLAIGLLTACGGSGENPGGSAVSGSSNVTPSNSKAKYNFACIMYDWEDEQGLYIKAYLKQLAEYYDINFTYVMAETVDDTLSAVETLCAKGDIDCILNSMSNGASTWGEVCKENGVYFTIPLSIANEEDFEYLAGNEYFLGSITLSDFTEAAKDGARELLDMGYKNVLITGFQEGFLDQCQQTMDGWEEVAAEYPGVTIERMEVSPADLFTSVTTALNDPTKNYDLIFSTVATSAFVLPNIWLNESLIGKVHVAGNNASADDLDAFNAGILVGISDILTGSYAFNVVLAMNAVDGNILPGTPTGEYLNYEVPIVKLHNAEEFEQYTQYVKNEDNTVFPFSVDELDQFLVSKNPSANYEELKTFLEESDFETIVARKQ